MSVSAQSTTELMVDFDAPSENPSGTIYRASFSDHSCEVSGDASPVTCLLTGLTSGTKYTVDALACLGDARCSSPISAIGYTSPDGKYA